MNEPSPVQPESAPPAAVYALPSFIPPWLGWLVATACFFATVFFAAKSFNVRGQLQSALESERVARLETGTLKNLLEAERILSRAQLDRLARTGLDQLVLLPLSSPDAQSAAHAVIALNPSLHEGLLVASNLPAPPADKSYHLWATPAASDPVHLGPLPPSDSTDVRLLFTLPAETRAFKITQDPEPPASDTPSLLSTH